MGEEAASLLEVVASPLRNVETCPHIHSATWIPRMVVETYSMIAANVIDLDRMSFQGNLDPDVCPAQDTISGEFKQRYRMNDIHTMYPSR
jgi:hypothetical protein